MSGEEAYDILIVGGGLVGASLACALAPLPLRIGVIEAAAPRDDAPRPSFDARTTALSYSSQQVFSAIDLWPAIARQGVAPIRRIHVSDRGRPGMARIEAAELGVEALGYVADNQVLGTALGAAMASLVNVDLMCPARPVHIELGSAKARVTIEEQGGERELQASLLVAADGGNSVIRKLTGARVFTAGYGQTAIIANVRPERPHQATAYERFTDTGPLALLPAFSDDPQVHRCALVWTARDEQVESIMELDETGFLQRLEQRFGGRLGRFLAIGTRHSYPLTLVHMQQQVHPRLVFIGNAAHTLHPVAGQGFNLGLRDVAALAQVVADGLRDGEAPGDAQMLRRYAGWRRRDHLQTTFFTDGLVRVFSNDLPPVALARNLGMTGLNLFPPLKRVLARSAMGFVGKLPRLARGLPL